MVTVNNSGKIVPSCLNELKELVEDESLNQKLSSWEKKILLYVRGKDYVDIDKLF